MLLNTQRIFHPKPHPQPIYFACPGSPFDRKIRCGGRGVSETWDRGFFIGKELVRNHDTLEPADIEASFIVDRMREKGILMGTDGPYHNVVKIRPPMPFSEENADQLVETMDAILEADFSG